MREINTQSDKKKDKKIDIISLLRFYSTKWKYILVSVIVFMILGGIYAYTKSPIYEVQANVLITDNDTKNDFLRNFSMADMFGGKAAVDDEIALMYSHTLFNNIVREYQLNEQYIVKKNLLKKVRKYDDSPIELIIPQEFSDTLTEPVIFKLNVSKSGKVDVKMKKTMFEYVISNNDVSFIWQYAQKHNLGVGYSQPDYFVANKMTYGFELDMHNCDVDYILTNHMEKYLKGSVWKVSISDSKSRIDSIYDEMKSIIELNCNVKVVHSTDTMIDIIHKDCEKLNSVNRLLKNLEISWKDVSSIGDGSSDAPVLEASGLGVTLENGCEACKKVAKKIVPSCYEDGCIEWLKEL